MNGLRYRSVKILTLFWDALRQVIDIISCIIINVFYSRQSLLNQQTLCTFLGLCFIQPLMALFRPHPNGKYRPLFNWTHWFVGNSAQIVAFAAIFFAVELQKAELPPETTYLLIAYVIFHALVHLFLTPR